MPGRQVTAVPNVSPNPMLDSMRDPRLLPDPNGLVVQSNPSGAEIIVNDQITGLVTPSRIVVPTQETFSITLRKKGYHDFKRQEVTRDSLGGRIDATMIKMNVGYLDVEIFPPQDAILYVNGKPVPVHRNLAREIMVPGNVPVRIRAESPSTNSYDETTVVIATDRRKTIQINPRKIPRAPSGVNQ
ncbi:MAG: PEGA domain-containing protein [Calothrix sp. SM1_5_4]|nr:PEGA domain-containing protein [Calothrix sp. SM1_5_4]